jgi:glutaminyl-peptide cyclotransferase
MVATYLNHIASPLEGLSPVLSILSLTDMNAKWRGDDHIGRLLRLSGEMSNLKVLRGTWTSLLHGLLALFIASATCYTPLSDDSLRNMPRPQESEFDIHTGSILSPILIPRVPGTPGSAEVQRHFVDFFQKYLPDWELGFQNTTFTTPVHGDTQVPFANFIATRDPPWSSAGDVGHLTLVAHYDSKYTPDGFIGATDSAAPCAMIMHAVKTIDAALTKKWKAMQTSGVDLDFEEHVGIQVLFLDGEEAFQSWTETDSIYGARALADHWDQTFHPPGSRYKTYLDSIELFVLLDLLGSPDDLTIPSWFKLTHPAYQNMANTEQRLRSLGLFKSKEGRTWLPDKDKKHDDRFSMQMYMQDDHIPFIAKGVEVLHLIPQRFPSVWHHSTDDGEHLDMPAVEDWAVLTAAFAAEYMDLEGYLDASGALKRSPVEVISKTEL